MAATSPHLPGNYKRAFDKIVGSARPDIPTYKDVRNSMLQDGLIPASPKVPASSEYKKSPIVPRWGKALLAGSIALGIAGGIAGLKVRVESQDDKDRRHAAVAAARVALADPDRLAQVGACERDIRHAIQYYSEPGAASADDGLSLPAYEAAATLADQHAVPCVPQDLDPESRTGVTVVYMNGQRMELNENRVLYPTLNY